MCGGIFNNYFITRLLPSSMVKKKIENWSTFGELMGKRTGVPFFDSRNIFVSPQHLVTAFDRTIWYGIVESDVPLDTV